MPRYAELIYNGFWFSPEREMLQALIDKSQEHVTGTVRVKLYKGFAATPPAPVAGRPRPCARTWCGSGKCRWASITFIQALEQVDLFLAVGTSGTVYPAAGFVQEAKRAGAWTVELTLEPGEVSGIFDENIYGPATEVVPDWVSSKLT
jgi:hypothetical protein